MTSPPTEGFPEKIFCPQCRQHYLVGSCQARANTILTDVRLSCPRCRRRLLKFRLKDWYERYVHGQDSLR